MTIPSFKILKKNAAERVAASENASKVVLVYSGILTLMALLITAVNFLLDSQIAQTGGLSNMGLRTMLSTVRSVLPMIQSVVSMCLAIGYMAAMLRISRRQYTSAQTLRLGFSRFWLLLRCTLLQTGIYIGVSLASFWISSQVFLLMPGYHRVLELVAPYSDNPATAMETIMSGEVYGQLVEAMIPMLLVFAAVYILICIPLIYSFRMINYLIIDNPAMSSVAILRESRRMMRGHRMRLFRLDVSLWWWYLLSVLLSVIAYGDAILPAAGISLPFSQTVAYYLFYFLFLAGQFAVTVLLRNRIEVVYAQVYDAVKPREKQEGVVLGNIFQM